MEPEAESPLTMLHQYFTKDGRFAAPGHGFDDLSRFKLLLIPHLEQLSEGDRAQVIALIGRVAVGEEPAILANRQDALDVLHFLASPWPIDRRRWILPAKRYLLRAFTDTNNLFRWAHWKEEDGGIEWCHGPAYVLTLYAVLLTISTDGELNNSVEYLINSTQSKEVNFSLRTLAMKHEGIRLCSSKQFSESEYNAHLLEVQRKLRQMRKQKPDRGQEPCSDDS